MRHRLVFSILAAGLVSFANPQARELTLADRIDAQAAIDRVYYTHQIGAARSFEDAVPRSALERKVVNYLRQSVLLEQYWHIRITGEALQRELERIINHTRAPDRLREVFAALGNDAFLIQECLARPVLVDRLARGFFAGATRVPGPYPDTAAAGDDRSTRSWDSWWERVATSIDFRAATVAARDASDIALDRGFPGDRINATVQPHLETADTTSACPDDRWDNGILDDIPDPGLKGTWTGSQLVVWGGYRAVGGAAGWLYDPTTDTWTPMATANAPSLRVAPSIVWARGMVIVWGGQDASTQAYLNTGGRYNPLTNTWLPVTTIGAPEPRSQHLGASTGTMMIVWAGYSAASGNMATGGRYDPSTDTWTTMNPLGAPLGRVWTQSVWTGTELIVWGGLGDSGVGFTNSGGRYDPTEDSWHPTSTVGAPSPRQFPSAVWTGTRMIIWGGFYDVPLSDGGLYDPATDTWQPTGTQGVPSGRENASAVWTGTEMVVWGGWGGPNRTELEDGARYRPTNNRWTSLSNLNAPSPRRDAVTAWTGQVMIVWGGSTGHALNDGGRYDPASDSWTPTSTGGAPQARDYHTTVWTGTHMIVWGGEGPVGLASAQLNTGGRYDPMLDAWTPTATAGAAQARMDHQAVWSGGRMVVWGGRNCSGSTCVSLNSGGRYEPLSDTWSPTTLVNAPAPRIFHSAVSTGDSMIVFGGVSENSTAGTLFNSGGRYDPLSDSWTATSTSGAPFTSEHRAVWTGRLMIVVGPNAGGKYDPVTDSWSGAPTGPRGCSVVWTGNKVVVWGGGNNGVSTGYVYNPTTGAIYPTSTQGAPSPRTDHSAVWSGSSMIIWGGRVLNNHALADGARYDLLKDTWSPISTLDAPPGRWSNSTVWTGDSMIVWGGYGGVYWNNGGRYFWSQDADHDGFTICGGDCDDSRAAVHPGAVEACNSVDDNCNGVVDESVDADGDGRFTCVADGDCDDADATVWASPGEVSSLLLISADPAALSWDGQAAATGPSVTYQVASGPTSGAGIDFSSATCLATVASPQFADSRSDPAIGIAFWYLIRARDSCGTGTYGSTQIDVQIPPCP